MVTTIPKVANLEQAWRALIPVDSFVKEPVEITPIILQPGIGIRWGRPAEFEFELAQVRRKPDGSELEIRNAPITYETVEIVGSDEAFRKFKLGKIAQENEDFEAEDTVEWLFDGNTSHSFPTKDIWQVDYERTVNVYFRFILPSEGQVIYVESEHTKEERGEFPEGNIWTGVEILK